MKLSICVFIKDNNRCGFGLWESMAQLMPFADEFFVMDIGSSDDTFEILKDLASKNKKIRLEQGELPVNPDTSMVDAGSFALLPNIMINECKNDHVMYYQADEIFHEDLLSQLDKRLKKPIGRGISFWRYQLQNNFQQIKWFPHIVHRIDLKERFVFAGDGMNTTRTNDAELCSNLDASWFTRWGAEYSKDRLERVDKNGQPHIYGTSHRRIEHGKPAHEMPTNEMILDISSLGGFFDNVEAKTKAHAPYWRINDDVINIGGQLMNLEEWKRKESNNDEWKRTHTKFNIPAIMRPLLGVTKYPTRQNLLDKIANS